MPPNELEPRDLWSLYLFCKNIEYYFRILEFLGQISKAAFHLENLVCKTNIFVPF
jgi:hypothetical protein